MERLMQYVWQHRLWPAGEMSTSEGERVQVIDPGKLNTDSGPDFFNAKIRIGRELWAGDVEIHVNASDWHRHKHDGDPAYESVILHVVGRDDTPIKRGDGRVIPQVKMPCSPDFSRSYDRLVGAAVYHLPCADEIKGMPTVKLRAWLDSLAYERLYKKSERIDHLLRDNSGDWESVCYVTVARGLGFGLNSEPFERLALSTPLRILHKHCDSHLSMEAVLFGQAGMLDCVDDSDAYVGLLKREYAFLANKFSLKKPVSLGWKMARMRPPNFPHRRIAFLAALLFGGFRLMSRIMSAASLEDARKLFAVELAGYWASHYTFGGGLDVHSPVALGRASVDTLIINVVAPLLHAYGCSTGNLQMSDRAVAFLQELSPEQNSIIRMFRDNGVECPDAFTSQALIQLRREYCETRKCLFCRIGHQYLSKKSKNNYIK
ncbi:MAG: DUF2851 family protein [Muribaculum sp.]|nr:DUF2851 family protein [Muribaculum sp.]